MRQTFATSFPIFKKKKEEFLTFYVEKSPVIMPAITYLCSFGTASGEFVECKHQYNFSPFIPGTAFITSLLKLLKNIFHSTSIPDNFGRAWWEGKWVAVCSKSELSRYTFWLQPTQLQSQPCSLPTLSPDHPFSTIYMPPKLGYSDTSYTTHYHQRILTLVDATGGEFCSASH